jgi:imidazolonepropionase-like amidohydrolase
MGFTTFDDFYAARIGVIGRLRQHGVTVITGVDSGMAPAKQHGNVWRAVGELVEGGYPTADALAAATSVAADACRLGSETGRLAKGLSADILLVEGDVSKDVSLLSRPQEVLVRGTPVQVD